VSRHGDLDGHRSWHRRLTVGRKREICGGCARIRLHAYCAASRRARQHLNTYCAEYLNLLLNFHRPCLFSTDKADPKKPRRIKRVYRPQDALTPLDKLASLPDVLACLRKGITLECLRELATALTDVQTAEELNEARHRAVQAFKRVRARIETKGAANQRCHGRLWTCGRCADAHRHGSWATLSAAHRPRLRPNATAFDHCRRTLEPKPQYTDRVYNRLTLRPSPRSGLSRSRRLIPRLEKTESARLQPASGPFGSR
jgi:hypothetical protein